jgi:predicted Ser/Thr protein kinase
MTCPSCGATNEPAVEVCFSCRTVLAAVSRGTILAGRYEVRDLLGRGGMGTVYGAYDRVLDEEVAIKVLRADVARAPGMAERFLSETRMARRVSHRNVCRIHEYGEEGGLRFISMERVDGKSLKELLAEGPLPAARAFDAVEQAARGLAAIHEVGIVHRDLKPANLTCDSSGRVRVMDFGIAKTAGLPGDTTAGYLLGSPEYMSPEQARGRGASRSSDLYALGVVAFELFTGAPPFRAETPVATLLLHIEAPPSLDAPGLPPSVVPVLRRALAKDPRLRQGSADALADELQAAMRVGAAGPFAPSAGGLARILRVPRPPAWIGGLLIAAALVATTLARRAAREEALEPPSVSASPLARAYPPTRSDEPAPSASAGAVAVKGRPARVKGSAPPVGRATDTPATGGRSLGTPPPVVPYAPAVIPVREEAATTEVRSERPVAASEPGPLATPPAAAPGFLLVVVSPWANVAIDGEPAGQTPLARVSLAAGAHTVRLTHPDYQPYPRRVVVKSGETTRLAVDLTQDGVRARP